MFVVPSGVLADTLATAAAVQVGSERATTAWRTGAQIEASRILWSATGSDTTNPGRGGGGSPARATVEAPRAVRNSTPAVPTATTTAGKTERRQRNGITR
jgi:hypothetical protein